MCQLVVHSSVRPFSTLFQLTIDSIFDVTRHDKRKRQRCKPPCLGNLAYPSLDRWLCCANPYHTETICMICRRLDGRRTPRNYHGRNIHLLETRSAIHHRWHCPSQCRYTLHQLLRVWHFEAYNLLLAYIPSSPKGENGATG